MSAHQTLWVRDRYKCKCMANAQFQTSCEGVDEAIASGKIQFTGVLTAGRAFKIYLPLCRVMLIQYEVMPHEMSTFSGDVNDTRLMLAMRDKAHGNFEHWLGVDETYAPAIRASVDFYKSLPEYEACLNLFRSKRDRINCTGRNHLLSDDSLHLLLARQFSAEDVALALTYTMSNTGKCFSCWDAARMASSGALVPQL